MRRGGRARPAPALLAALVVLAGCTSGSDATPTPTAPSSGPDRCREAVTAIVEATQGYVDGFGPVEDTEVPRPASPSPAATVTPPASPSPSASEAQAADADFQQALTTARTQLVQNGCDAAATRTALQEGLAGVSTVGPLAAAVLRQLTATITGSAEASATTREVATDDDLLAAVADLPAGSTIVLAPGVHEVDETVVLLSPVTIRGSGVGTTVLESTAPDFGLLVIADGTVGLDDLSVRHTGSQPASVVLAGPSASVVVTDAEVSGGIANGDGTGGAGVLMYDPGATARRTATSLEVTRTTFSDNGSAGVVLTGGHVASIASSTFTANAQCGVCFLDASGGSIQDSAFTRNTVGVAATGTAAPTLLRSSIRGGEVGVQAGDSSAPVVDDVRISGSTRAALIWAGRAEGALQGVTCTGVKFGLVIGPDVAPTVRGSASCEVAPSG